MKTLITFRLRKELDADLIAINIGDQKLQELCRDGLRLMLGIRTAKQLEVKEKQIVIPTEKKSSIQPQVKSAVYVPPKKM